MKNAAQPANEIKIKCLIKEALYNSLSQSIIKPIETPYIFLKTFLFVCIIATTGLCSCLIVELALSFLSYGVTTTSRTLYETTTVTFPKLTICNINPFTTEYASQFLQKINRDFFPHINIFDDVQMNKLNFSYRTQLYNEFHFMATFRMTSLDEHEKRKLSHSLQDLIPTCSFSNYRCNLNEDFVWHFDPWYGNCWMFNQANGKTNSVPGEFYGLRLNFYVNFHQNLTSLSSYNDGGGRGLLLRLENASYLTSYVPMDGIKVESGRMTSIGVSRSLKSSLPRPYSNCLIDNRTNAGFKSELFDLILNSNYLYTQPTCYWQCVQRVLLLSCNCTDSGVISLLPNARLCTTLDDQQCMFKLYGEKINKINFSKENCLSECPLECYLERFDASLSSIELVSNMAFDYLSSNSNLSSDFVTSFVDKEKAAQSIVGLNVFYKTLSYDMSNESPQITLVVLFANIGGYLGLFLGMSVFSIFEPFIIGTEILFIKFGQHRKGVSP